MSDSPHEVFGPLSPILSVPVDEPVARDWGDVHDDVMEMIERYSAALELFATGQEGRLGHVRDCVEMIEDAERRLGIHWDAHGNPSAQPRRWQYRVC